MGYDLADARYRPLALNEIGPKSQAPVSCEDRRVVPWTSGLRGRLYACVCYGIKVSDEALSDPMPVQSIQVVGPVFPEANVPGEPVDHARVRPEVAD
jgi:hypothetical protein